MGTKMIMLIQNYNLNTIFKRNFMKTSKTSLGAGEGGGGEDPNKNKFTFKSGHENDSRPPRIEINYQKINESNQQVIEKSDEISSSLSKVLEDIGINVERLNDLALKNMQHEVRIMRIEQTIEDNTTSLNTLRTEVHSSIQTICTEFEKKLKMNRENQEAVYQQHLYQTNQNIAEQNILIQQQIAQYRQDILNNNQEVINNTTARINEIAQNATTSIFNNITNFILTFGGLFETRFVGYIGILVIAVSGITLMMRMRSNSAPQTIIIQTPPPMIEMPMQSPSVETQSTINTELRETGSIIVKLLKLMNKWLKIMYEKQLEKLEKFKK
jgi:hypothetical protein